MPKFFQLLLTLLALALPHAAGAQAELPAIRLEITSRVAEDRMFGHHGPWERISGVAHMRIDPAAPANRGIADLALAPRGADGLVAYDIDFAIVRSRAVEHVRRRMLLYDVVNRGMSLHSMFAFDRQNKHDTEPVKTGEGFLLSQGYTLVRSGWQGDIARPGLLGARFPVASQNGQPVTGLVATETIFDNTSATSMTLTYAAASLDQPGARLTVRARADDAPVVIAPADWRFENDRKIVITRPANMDAGAIYRFEYTARDPWVMGLGFAATRDFISWLRHATAEQGNPLADLAAAYCERDAKGACANPEGGIFSTAVAFGASQSGRYLRDFVWQGFNRDLAGRRVFDGVIPFIPGARQTFTNFRFAEPGRFSRQHEDHDVPGFTFPFAYATLKDPVTGKSDGILKSCTATRTCPRIFHIDTSAEFWQAGSSLVGTGGTGRDVPFPADVRAYMIAGGAHAPGMMLPACRYPANSFNYTPIVRALVTAMIDWTVGRQAPPASQWPRLAKGELVAIESLRGPEVPALGLTWARVANQPIAPAGRPGWPVHVPAIDADGNDAAGIRLPQIAAPEGTYLGWNLRKAGYGEGDLCLLAGSYLPFAKDAASRGSDPRAPLAERYPSPGSRAAVFSQAIDKLRKERLLEEFDAQTFVREVARDWLPNDFSTYSGGVDGQAMPAGHVQPWDNGFDCSWDIRDVDGIHHLASIGRGEESMMLSLTNPLFLGWPEDAQPRVTLTFDRDPRRRVEAVGWVSHAGGAFGGLGIQLNGQARRAMAGARRLQISRDGKTVLDLLLNRTPGRAQLDACVPRPKGPNSDEE